MTWAQGRIHVEQLIADGRVQRVEPNRGHSDRLIEMAERHLKTAMLVAESDPESAYAAAYDAARRALSALLAVQGLRVTSNGGHWSLYAAVSAQLDPPHGPTLRPFDRIRRRRNQIEYPRPETRTMTSREVLEDVPRVRRIVAVSERIA